MDEATLEKTRDFDTVAAVLSEVIGALLPYIEQRFARASWRPSSNADST